MSADPAMEDYLPKTPINEQVAQSNEDMLGQGVFNPFDLDVYSYATNNPIKYRDPDGKQTDEGEGGGEQTGKKFVPLQPFVGDTSEESKRVETELSSSEEKVFDIPIEIAGGGGAKAPSAKPTGDQEGGKAGVATTKGGAASVRTGQAGESAVRAEYDIGSKRLIDVNGRGRIADGLTDTKLSEVKNTKTLSLTQQLRDYAQFAAQNGLGFDLYVRPGVKLSGPLLEAVKSGRINLIPIPFKEGQ